MRNRFKPQTIATLSFTIALLSLLFAVGVWAATGGSTDSSTPPADTNSYTLADIYARLDAGTEGIPSAFAEPAVAPGTGTMNSLNDIMGKAPVVDDTAGAGVTDVASGKTFWGLTSGAWGLRTGTASLGGTYNAAVPKTGAGDIAGYTENANEDGTLQKGVAWPNPRFIDNSNGTVTDNLTGLIWLKDASCADLAGTDTSGKGTWSTALSAANSLAHGTCGLSDSSNAGAWRLPTVLELQSLVHSGFTSPALPNTAGTGQWTEGNPFTGVQSSYYWSSTSNASSATNAWTVELDFGSVLANAKAFASYVWPVRGGQ